MLTRESLAAELAALGLEPGDSVIVHSSLRALGPVDGGAETVIDVLLDAIGPRGNLVMPTFNYSRPLPEPCFDPATTPGRTGVLAEVFRKRALRSLHPTHSVAALGPDAARLTRDHLAVRAMGVGSPIDLLAAMGGKVLLLGVSQTSNSTIHVGEEHAGVPKVSGWDPLPCVQVGMPDGSLVSHRLDTSPSCSAAFDAVEYPLRARGAIRDGRIGGALARLMVGRELIDCVVQMIAREPAVLRCSNPRCVPCTGARALIERRGPS